jgi:hypothetical protein
MKRYNLFSAAGAVLLFINFAGADTLSIPLVDAGGDVIDTGLFWSPTQSQFSALIKNVKQIVSHENKTDTSELGRIERKNFLAYLSDWKGNTRSRCFGILNNFCCGDRIFYRGLHELVNFSDSGNIYMLQAILIGEYWPMHIAHGQGNYVPIWSDAQIEAYYASRPQPTKAAAESAPKIVATPDSSENNFWGF